MITLTSQEKKLFQILLQTSRSFLPAQKVILRVAGGWVRDKLLNRFSDDIDIAVQNCSPEDFSRQFKGILDFQGESIKGFGNIKKDKSKGKNVEITTFYFDGVSLDFVQLRGDFSISTRKRLNQIRQISVLSNQNSLLPDLDSDIDSQLGIRNHNIQSSPHLNFEMSNPTQQTKDTLLNDWNESVPLIVQDAYLRDSTLNSLFYNLETEEIEDHTGQGLEDLQQAIIRTPLPFSSTVYADPLRALRSIRFRCKYGFSLDQDLYICIKNDQILKLHFIEKISRERVGKELVSVFPYLQSEGHPRFLFSLHDLDYLSIVFFNCLSSTIDQNHSLITSRKMLFNKYNLYNSMSDVTWNQLSQFICYLENKVAQVSFQKFTSDLLCAQKKPKPPRIAKSLKGLTEHMLSASVYLAVCLMPFADDPITEKMNQRFLFSSLRDNLKISHRLPALICLLQDCMLKVKQISTDLSKDPQCKNNILNMGLFILDLEFLWPQVVAFARLADLISAQEEQSLLEFSHLHQLPSVLNRVPFYNGKQLSQKFKIRGKFIKEALETQKQWIILNSNGTVEQFDEFLSKHISK